MSNNLSNSNTIMAGIKEVGHKVFGGYAELLRIPHTARYSIGSVIACMPFPMVGMTITISVQHYYGNYSLAGMLTAIQAIALAVATPLLGKLTDKFGQRQVSIPTILVWIVAAVALTTSITNRAPEWVLYCLTPFLAAIPPWGAMSRARWTKILKGDQERTNRALSLCGVLDECMWVIGNPLASTLAVISGLLAFSFTGMCVVVGALMFLTELTTEPPSQTQLARAEGISRKEYREREAARAEALKVETAAEETRRRLEREGVTDEATINAAIEQAVADARSGKKASIWGPGLIAVCVTWFGLAPAEKLFHCGDHRIRHRVEYEAVHGLCIRLLLHQLVDGRLGVRREELVDCPVEALLLLPGRGEHRHQHVPVRQASVGDYDHLPDHRRVPGSDVD